LAQMVTRRHAGGNLYNAIIAATVAK
jgi:hypothetical protein